MARRSKRLVQLPFYPAIVLLLVGLGSYLGCDSESLSHLTGTVASGTGGTASTSPQYSASIPQRSESTILLGSFNMQRLGPTKLKNDWVMERFAQIIRCYDVIAIQEITSQDQTTLPQLLAHVNRDGSRYAYTISPRIGRPGTNGYAEQYAFIYDASRIQSGPEFTYVVQDEADMMHREPFVGRFATRHSNPFQFTIINVHTDPQEIAQELDVLADVYRNVRRFEYPEDDVILLGDLNQQPGSLQQLEQIPSVLPLIQGMPTNTRKSRTIDNILIDNQATIEFAGRAGTLDLESVFNIDNQRALEISDHLPIWAEFTISEKSASSFATASTAVVR